MGDGVIADEVMGDRAMNDRGMDDGMGDRLIEGEWIGDGVME
jgi:hypothetical protein